jgi:hypothetical protein
VELNVIQEIAYRQLLTRAGFKIHAITSVRSYRGSGTGIMGAFERDGKKLPEVMILETKTGIAIAGQLHQIVIHDDGTFDLFVAHSDGPH